MEPPNMNADMAQFFDFGEATMPDVSRDDTGDVGVSTISPPNRGTCPAHGDDNQDGCLCHGFQDDFGFQAPIEPEKNEIEWNPDFSSWIPRYHKPESPCDYCRSRGLECFIYDGNRDACSPCNALFRPCSFTQPGKTHNKSKTALDTLDIVSEDTAHLFGGLTGKKPMRCLGHVGPIEKPDEADKASKKGAAAARFPRAAVMVLKNWMEDHIDHPYPTEEDKEELKNKTGLTSSQISNWMANTRRRHKTRQKRCASPSLRPSTGAIDIPAGRTWESLDPFERWKHSPPENEPAPMTAIAKAVETFDPPEPPSLSSSFGARKGNSNGSTSGSFSVFRAPSTTSLETGFTNVSSGSAQSHGSAWSYGSRNSFGSLNSNAKKDRRRRRRVPPRTPKLDTDATAARIFQCTFCTDKFKSKYDWSRHEKTLHLSLEKWICAPLGEVITCSSSGQRKCVYCDALDPSKEHLETHNHRACEDKGLEARTFYRKDHLRQHLRLMHNCKMTPAMESWKAEATFIKCRCGFCGMDFDKWQDRVDHLAKEFRNGAQMKDWKGCRGLDPHVAALVTNAMPPYLISNESKSPFPFSASNASSMSHHNLYLVSADLEAILPYSNQSLTPFMGDVNMPASGFTNEGPSDMMPRAPNNSISPTTANWNTPQTVTNTSTSPQSNSNATCWEILTVRLGHFARTHLEQNGPDTITDEALQREARRILYDDPDDTWNQTAADNPEWLALFKQAHGIIAQPANANRQDMLEDLGINGDWNTFEDLMSGEWGDPMACALTGSNRLSAKHGSNLGLGGLDAFKDLNVAIPELACNPNGNPICVGENGEQGFSIGALPNGQQDCYQFPTWDQLPEGFEIPGHQSSTALTESMTFNQPELVHGSMGGAQVMRWDDKELEMSMDFHA